MVFDLIGYFPLDSCIIIHVSERVIVVFSMVVFHEGGHLI